MADEKVVIDPYRRTVALVLAVTILGLAFLIIRPFIIAILSAAALSYIFYPMYKFLLSSLFPKILRQRTICSIITCFVIIVLVLIPTIILSTVLAYETREGYKYFRHLLETPGVSISALPINFVDLIGGKDQLNNLIGDFAGQVFEWAQKILKGVPNIVLSIFITIFSTYYFLKHGKDIYEFFKGIFPLPEKRYKQIISRFDDLSRGMIMGQIFVGSIQGFLTWAVLYYLHFPNPVLWGFITSLICIIPLLGAAMVWLPIDIYLFINGYLTGNYTDAIILLVCGTFVISLIDNFLKPKIVGDHAKIHPLVILFGILGGIQLFGIPGILIGPLILTLFDVVIEIYRETL
ncbi:AI-2E family transporter [Candidatus Saganbacteria bacterium]|nr:AI-2E family transporter [Candidatus Saganbacteria bacterium]